MSTTRIDNDPVALAAAVAAAGRTVGPRASQQMAGGLHIGNEAAIEQPVVEDCSASPARILRAPYSALRARPKRTHRCHRTRRASTRTTCH